MGNAPRRNRTYNLVIKSHYRRSLLGGSPPYDNDLARQVTTDRARTHPAKSTESHPRQPPAESRPNE